MAETGQRAYGLDLGADDIHLWFARPPALADSGIFRAYESLLSDAERERLGRFRFERHRHEYLLTRALVRTTLSHYLPVQPADWRFSHNAYGKPETDPPCGLRFNLSNSPGLVACVVSCGGEVGVDVEPWQRAGDILGLAEEVFSPQELAGIRRLAGQPQEDRGLSLWTLKESYVKARGMGLSLPLREFSFVFDGSAPIRLRFAPGFGDWPERWRFGLLDHAGHRVAVVAEHADRPRLKLWEARPLLASPLPLRDGDFAVLCLGG